ncbi:hypothetical protein [Senegalia massiliensis]|uniref:Uncharacterized protein n=1 Tax=Senegalia massiliensis TaxID=1720316 RepID=A0A845R1C7_9CLOT|nr:hypothetical protein [Senegalia massiliensis]NBI08220.1 hypothetical protein [Senegalia massiliensis]
MKGCKFCKEDLNEWGYIGTTHTCYGEFGIEIIEDKLRINDDYGHEDTIDISFCPMCGTKLRKLNNDG